MKNRHGVCRGIYLALSLGLIISVTVYSQASCASDALKPLDQATGASSAKFNPQAIFDLLGLKRIEYPRPGAQLPRDDAPPDAAVHPSSHAVTIDEGKRAQAALSIVSFQVRGKQIEDDRRIAGTPNHRHIPASIDSETPSNDAPEVDQLSLSPPTLDCGSKIGQGAPAPNDPTPHHESSEPLAEDGSFDLTVSSTTTLNQSAEATPAPSDSDSSEQQHADDAAEVADETADPGRMNSDSVDAGSFVEDNSLLESNLGSNEVAETPAIDPWDDPRLFEPVEKSWGSHDRSDENMNLRSEPVERPAMVAKRQRPSVPPDRATTPIQPSERMPGPPPVADQVVAHQARLMIDDGIQLARRGAIYSARARFIRALRLITQSFDAQAGTRYYSESLARGFRALEEVNDFRPKGSRLEADLDLGRIVQSHRTPVLHRSDFRRLTNLVAQQAYHTYAENQLINAVGRDPVGADALFALGKLQGHLSQQGGDASTSGDARAMSLYQAALSIHPDHHQAANELGVLLARYGQLDDARTVLRHCVRNRKNAPQAWRNLARVHEQLGEVELARRANHEWQSALKQGSRSTSMPGRPSVQWVDPTTFANMSAPAGPSTPQNMIATHKQPERQVPAISRRPPRPALPSADGQPLSVGQRYGR